MNQYRVTWSREQRGELLEYSETQIIESYNEPKVGEGKMLLCNPPIREYISKVECINNITGNITEKKIECVKDTRVIDSGDIKSQLVIKPSDIKGNTITIGLDNPIPLMELRNNGDIFIKGKLNENDKEIVDSLRQFLKNQK